MTRPKFTSCDSFESYSKYYISSHKLFFEIVINIYDTSGKNCKKFIYDTSGMYSDFIQNSFLIYEFFLLDIIVLKNNYIK